MFIADHFRKEDIAKALVSAHVASLCQTIYLSSRLYNCKNVYLTGGLVNHALYRDMFFSGFLQMIYCDADQVN